MSNYKKILSNTATYGTNKPFVKKQVASSTSPLTTKGDVYTFSTSGARLAVGSDGQVLQADSSEATGLKWVTSTSSNYYVDSVTFNTGDGVLTLGRVTLSDLTVDLDGRYLLSGDALSPGGSTNDVQYKSSSSALGGVTLAKGKILSANSSGVPTVLAAGTDGYALVADSSAATGLNWAANSDANYYTSSATFGTDGIITGTIAGGGSNWTGDFNAGLTMSNSSSNLPKISMTNTNADNSSPLLDFIKDSASPAASDDLGGIRFYGDDSGGAQHNFARIDAESPVVTAGSEVGSIKFRTTDGGTDNTGLMILSGSSVGINTLKPNAMLNLAGADTVDIDLQDTNATGIGNLDARINWTYGGTGTAGTHACFIGTDEGEGLFKLGIESGFTSNFGIFTAGTERIRVNDTGEVGVGHTAPDYLFDVRKAGYEVMLVSGQSNGNYPVAHFIDSTDQWPAWFEGNRTGDPGAGIRLYHNPASVNANNNTYVQFSMNDSANAIHNYAMIKAGIDTATAGAEDGHLAFQTSRAATLTEAMRITHDGYVGIGTTSPEGILHTANNSGVNIFQRSNDSASYGTNFYIRKSRGTVGSESDTQSGDLIGQIGFSPYYGDYDNYAASISAKVTGTLGTDTTPGYLAFSTAAAGANTVTQRMAINESGQVGIGTTAPSYPLHVVQASGDTYGMYLFNSASRGIYFGDTSNDGSGYGKIGGVGGSLFLGSTQVYTSFIPTGDSNTTLGQQNRRWSYFFTRFGQVGYDTSTTTTAQFGISGAADKVPLEVYANGATAPALHVTSGSLVGIGLDTPTSDLHIKGELDIQSGNQTILMGAGNSSTARSNDTLKLARVGLAHYHNAEEPVAMLYAASNGTDNTVIMGGGTSNMNAATKLQFATAANDATTAGTTRMTITDGGAVGIGTDAPSQKFEVNGGGTSTYMKIVGQNNTGYIGQDSVGMAIYQEANASMYFATNNTTRMTLTNGGNLGIGTGSPGQKLVVSGGATVLDNAGGYALYFNNAGTQYGAIDTYGGSLSIEAASEAILSGASGIVLKGPGIFLGPTGTSAGNTQELKFRELAANGTAAISLKAPDSISNENRWVLPADIGTAGQVLSVASVSSTSMTLDWADPAYTGTIAGSLSDNYIPIGTASNTIGNFILGLTENDSIYLGSNPESTTNTAQNNTALGISALNDITTGDNNTAIGIQAGQKITTQERNTIVGVSALRYASGSASYNTAIGFAAMGASDQESTSTVAIGYYALSGATSTQATVAVGHLAARDLTTGDHNIAIGKSAMLGNTTSNYSTAIGSECMQIDGAGTSTTVGYYSMNAHSGDNCVAMGAYALRKGTGAYNVGLGVSAMTNVSGGVGGVAIGYQSGYHPTGNYNTWLGYNAGFGTAAAGASNNVGVGKDAMMNISSGVENVAVGDQAGYAISTGGYNVAIGSDAFRAATTANYNVAIGKNAMNAGTLTSNHNVAIGYNAASSAQGAATENVALGSYAGQDITTGVRNTFVGTYAGTGNTTGQDNVAVGHSALQENQEGDDMVAIGRYAAYNTNPTADTGDSVVIGSSAGFTNTTGVQNTFVGHKAGYSNTTSSQHVFVGREAGYYNTTGTANVFVGSRAGFNNVSGSLNTAIGYQALQDNNASSNVGIGYQAGQNVTTGGSSVYIGDNAGRTITDAGSNVMVGYQAGYPLGSSASSNVIVGSNAAVAATASTSDSVLIGAEAGYSTGGKQIAIGKRALYFPEGNYNVAIGESAMYGASATTTAQQNVAIGRQAGYATTSGYSNTSIGYQTSYSMTTGAGNTHLGVQAGYSGSTHNNTTFIGNSAGLKNTSNDNVAIGAEAYLSGSSATQIVAIGRSAGKGITTGQGVIAIGPNAAQENEDGTHNVAIGWQAMMGASGKADRNVGIGTSTLLDISTGESNVGVGYQAGQNISTGDYNIAIGNNALASLTTYASNVAVGHNAGHDTNQADNVMIGSLAGYSSESSGSTLVGFQAGYYPHGNHNTFVGYKAGKGDSSGVHTAHNNVAVGREALTAATSAEKNTILGTRAAAAITTQNASVFVGFEAGLGQQSGSGGNVALGHQALYSGTQNYQNTAIGINAGKKATGASSNNVYLGSAAGPSSTGAESNKLYIHNAEGTPLIGGDFSAGTVTIDGVLSATAKSFNIEHPLYKDKRLVHGSLEGPEHGIYIRGTIEASNGCEIELPDYWQAMCEDYTVQLTPHGPYTVFIQEKHKDKVMIASSSQDYKFDYFIVGKRTDEEFEVVQDA